MARIQATDAPDILNIVTTPKPVGLPIVYTGTEITLPLCGSGADQKMTWKVYNTYTIIDFIDFASEHTLTQRANITGNVWADVAGGYRIVEIESPVVGDTHMDGLLFHAWTF